MPSRRVLMVLINGFTHDPRVSIEAESLTRRGYEVTVLCWDHGGKLPETEVRDGVRIVRLRNTPYMRLLRYDLFRLRPFWRIAMGRALDLHKGSPFDVVHCHDLDTLPIGVRFKERTNVPLVYDAHEVFPYALETTRARRWAGRFEAMERRLITRVDLAIAAGRGHMDYLRPLTGSPIVVVTNSRPLTFPAYEPPSNPRMVVSFYGGLYPVRLLVPLAELAVDDGSFDVEIAGDGSLAGEIRALAARSRGHLRYLGVLPMGEVLLRTRASDVVFSVTNPRFRICKIGVPNRFFEALVAGRPLVVSKGTWAGSEVEAAECGLAVEYSKESLHEALQTLRDDPGLREKLGRNADRLARERYNWKQDEATLLKAYSDLLGQ